MTRLEVLRKLFHFVVLGIVAAVTYVWGRRVGIVTCSGLVVISLAVEVARRGHTGFSIFLDGAARGIIKEGERKRVIASAYAALSSLFVLIVFSVPSAIVGISLLAVGDPAAYVSGKAFGRGKGKTKEGVLGCIIVCFAMCYLIFGLSAWKALVLGVSAAIAEALPLVDDNLSIPLVVAIVAEWLSIGF